MKFTFIFLFVCTVLVAQEPPFITEFHNAIDKKSEQLFINTYKKTDITNAKAYVISLEMKQAEYAVFPWKKLSIFNKGKKELSGLIKQYPDNPHFRYVRLLIQENTPKILGYNKQIQEDKKVLQKFLDKTDDTDYLDTYILKNTSL